MMAPLALWLVTPLIGIASAAITAHEHPLKLGPVSRHPVGMSAKQLPSYDPDHLLTGAIIKDGKLLHLTDGITLLHKGLPSDNLGEASAGDLLIYCAATPNSPPLEWGRFREYVTREAPIYVLADELTHMCVDQQMRAIFQLAYLIEAQATRSPVRLGTIHTIQTANPNLAQHQLPKLSIADNTLQVSSTVPPQIFLARRGILFAPPEISIDRPTAASVYIDDWTLRPDDVIVSLVGVGGKKSQQFPVPRALLEDAINQGPDRMEEIRAVLQQYEVEAVVQVADIRPALSWGTVYESGKPPSVECVDQIRRSVELAQNHLVLPLTSPPTFFLVRNGQLVGYEGHEVVQIAGDRAEMDASKQTLPAEVGDRVLLLLPRGTDAGTSVLVADLLAALQLSGSDAEAVQQLAAACAPDKTSVYIQMAAIV